MIRESVPGLYNAMENTSLERLEEKIVFVQNLVAQKQQKHSKHCAVGNA